MINSICPRSMANLLPADQMTRFRYLITVIKTCYETGPWSLRFVTGQSLSPTRRLEISRDFDVYHYLYGHFVPLSGTIEITPFAVSSKIYSRTDVEASHNISEIGDSVF